MARRFSQMLLIIKIAFLILTVFFLIRGSESAIPHVNNEARIFTVTRDATDVTMQINNIMHYLDATTGQSVALAVVVSGTTTLVLPATTDYETYKSYLLSIAPSDYTTTAQETITQADSAGATITNASTTIHYAIAIICFLLALFL